MPKNDWETIREYYIAGKVDPKTGTNKDYTYGDICRRFHIKQPNTVKRHADLENWKADREVYKKRHREMIREELRASTLPTIIEIRQTILKAELATIKRYVELLKSGEMDGNIKPLDALRAGEFVIAQYHILYGVQEEEKKPAQDVNLHIDFGDDEDDLYDAAASFIRSKTEEN